MIQEKLMYEKIEINDQKSTVPLFKVEKVDKIVEN